MRIALGLLLLSALFALAHAGGSTTTQVGVGLTPVKVGNEDVSRVTITVKAMAANSGKVYCSANPNVSTASGFELSARDGFTWDTPGAATASIYCVADTAAQTVCVEETTL